MIYLFIAILINYVLFVVWAITVEVRLFRISRALSTIATSIQYMAISSRTHNDQIKSLEIQNKTISKAIEGHSTSISNVVAAINNVSEEVFKDDILESTEKETIQ